MVYGVWGQGFMYVRLLEVGANDLRMSMGGGANDLRMPMGGGAKCLLWFVGGRDKDLLCSI